MVDIHCHILQEMDDGAQSLSEALEMARMAVSCGVTDLVTTSHFRDERLGAHWLQELQYQFRRLEKALAEEKIPLRLLPGAEILCTWGTVDLARDRALPTLGDTDYVLCEFYFDAEYDDMDGILEEIARAGYRPVIAHPERYGAIQREPRRVQRWFRKGYVIQVNKGSVLGAFGSRPRNAACWLLERGFVHLLASDAHSPYRRTTDLTHLKKWMTDNYPESYARLLLEENPARLIRGEEMTPTDPF